MTRRRFTFPGLVFGWAVFTFALIQGPASVQAQPRPGRPWLGVLLGEDNTPGILIKKVFPGSPAAAAGLKKGDRVFRVAGGGVPDISSMQQAVAAQKPGQVITLRLMRKRRYLTLRVKLKPMPTYEQRVKNHVLGKPAPAFQAARVGAGGSGRPAVISPKAMRGKVWLLEFWASWCGACRAVVPLLKQLHQKMGPQGLHIVAIAKDPVHRAAAMVRSLGIQYLVGADPRGNAMSAYLVNPIPAFMLVDQKGIVRGVAVGAGWPQDLRGLIITARRLLRAGTKTVPGRRRAPLRRRRAPGHF